MSIRKLWLIVLLLIAIISVSINTFVLSTLTDRYFKDYMAENYQLHLKQIIEYSKSTLIEDDLSNKQMSMMMETHLNEPITRIKLYDVDGSIIIDVKHQTNINNMMMNNNMMGRIMNPQLEEVDHVELTDKGKIIGQLNITRYSSVENSIATRMFKSSLVTNSLYSIAIVLIIALLIGLYMSKKMSKDLKSTAQMAQNISLGLNTTFIDTNIYEIKTIQLSLETLNTQLKLKNKSRKVLIDELVHQTRTPLTILKTHLEGYADDIIDMTPDEIVVCENQIENITEIISNMSNMIDAEKDYDTINFEEFELNMLLKQIVNGLKAQFDKKKIKLQLDINEKVIIKTDKYKLSQAIYNILINAYKYTNENGNVKINNKITAENIAIQIEDNGIGISEKDIDRIFDAYYRSANNLDINGEGLGLYIVKENLNKIQGNIQVSSKVNVGSYFIITIPKNIVKI